MEIRDFSKLVDKGFAVVIDDYHESHHHTFDAAASRLAEIEEIAATNQHKLQIQIMSNYVYGGK